MEIASQEKKQSTQLRPPPSASYDAAMQVSRKTLPFLSLPLAAALMMGGCNKKSDQPAQTTTDQNAQASESVPPPPPDASARSAAPASQTPASAPVVSPAPAPAPAPQPLVVPAGTRIRVSLGQALGSKLSAPGEGFSATVADPVVVNGVTVIPAGAAATGTVVVAHPLGRFKGAAELAVRLDTVRAYGNTYSIASSTVERAEKGKGKRTAGLIGGGAGLGALIGGLAGGGKGALIGGLVGAGAGTAGTAFTGNREIVIPAESLLTFRLEQPLTIRR
jgi:hypothetical protein